MVIWGNLKFFKISCNFTPFYPIEMGFSLEITEFYTDVKFLPFLS